MCKLLKEQQNMSKNAEATTTSKKLLKLKLESETLVRATAKHWQHRRRFRFDSCPSSCWDIDRQASDCRMWSHSMLGWNHPSNRKIGLVGPLRRLQGRELYESGLCIWSNCIEGSRVDDAEAKKTCLSIIFQHWTMISPTPQTPFPNGVGSLLFTTSRYLTMLHSCSLATARCTKYSNHRKSRRNAKALAPLASEPKCHRKAMKSPTVTKGVVNCEGAVQL